MLVFACAKEGISLARNNYLTILWRPFFSAAPIKNLMDLDGLLVDSLSQSRHCLDLPYILLHNSCGIVPTYLRVSELAPTANRNGPPLRRGRIKVYKDPKWAHSHAGRCSKNAVHVIAHHLHHRCCPWCHSPLSYPPCAFPILPVSITTQQNY